VALTTPANPNYSIQTIIPLFCPAVATVAHSLSERADGECRHPSYLPIIRATHPPTNIPLHSPQGRHFRWSAGNPDHSIPWVANVFSPHLLPKRTTGQMQRHSLADQMRKPNPRRLSGSSYPAGARVS